jgi:hypothetical protein
VQKVCGVALYFRRAGSDGFVSRKSRLHVSEGDQAVGGSKCCVRALREGSAVWGQC